MPTNRYQYKAEQKRLEQLLQYLHSGLSRVQVSLDLKLQCTVHQAH